MTEATKNYIYLSCNTCIRTTRHDALAAIEQHDSEDLGEGCHIDWYERHQILQCRGCGTVTFFTRSWNTDDLDEEGRASIHDNYFPPRTSHPQPKWIEDLEFELQQVLEEVYTAFHHQLRYLTAVGVRTAIDMMIVDKISDIGNFQQKIQKLQLDGHITSAERELIETLTEAGNAAAHRGYAPSIKNLDSILKILEALLHKFYIQEPAAQELLKQAQRLKAGVPKRHREPKP